MTTPSVSTINKAFSTRALQPIEPVSALQLIRAALYAVEIGLDLDGRAATPFRRAMQAAAAHLLCRAVAVAE